MLIKIICVIILMMCNIINLNKKEVINKKLEGYIINYEKTGNIKKNSGKEIITTI